MWRQTNRLAILTQTKVTVHEYCYKWVLLPIFCMLLIRSVRFARARSLTLANWTGKSRLLIVYYYYVFILSNVDLNCDRILTRNLSSLLELLVWVLVWMWLSEWAIVATRIASLHIQSDLFATQMIFVLGCGCWRQFAKIKWSWVCIGSVNQPVAGVYTK